MYQNLDHFGEILIADATYEIPVAFSVTKASNSEQMETKELLEKIYCRKKQSMQEASSKVKNAGKHFDYGCRSLQI